MEEAELLSTAAPHPEEMTCSLDVIIGGRKVVEARGRATPAGLVTAGILISSALLSTAVLIRAARRLIR